MDGKDLLGRPVEGDSETGADDDLDSIVTLTDQDGNDTEFEFLDIEDDNEFDKVAAEFERLVEESVD